MTAKFWARPVALAALLCISLAACGDDSGEGATSTSTTEAASASAASGLPTDTTRAIETTTATTVGTVVALTVRAGSVDGPSRQRVSVNERVTVRVTSDVADEVHVHGYDLTSPVGPGQPAEIAFPANIPGVWEVEFERSGRILFTLEVRP